MKSKISIGELRTTITIQRPITTPDAIGGSNLSWLTYKVVRAQIDSYRAREIVIGQQVTPSNFKKITARAISDITSDMRIQYGNPVRTYQIKSINYFENETRHFMEMLCEEGVAS